MARNIPTTCERNHFCNCDGSCQMTVAHVKGWDKMSESARKAVLEMIKAVTHKCRACGHCITEGCPQNNQDCPINKKD